MFSLLRHLGPTLRLGLEIREAPRMAPMPTAAPTKAAGPAAATQAATTAAQPDAGAAIKDKFSSNAPTKPTQQATLINPMTVAKLSMVSGKELPRELLANVASHLKGTQKKIDGLIPKQTAAAPQKTGQKKGGRKGGGKGKQMFDDGASEE